MSTTIIKRYLSHLEMVLPYIGYVSPASQPSLNCAFSKSIQDGKPSPVSSLHDECMFGRIH
jgi:hypothetical protein